jgi:pilus assembly protein Flp/PilA
MRAFIFDESGPTASEYAVMLALILLVAIASIGALGTKVDGSFAQFSQAW